jgi:hypothetical protein
VFHLGTAGDGSDVQRRIMLKKKEIVIGLGERM